MRLGKAMKNAGERLPVSSFPCRLITCRLRILQNSESGIGPERAVDKSLMIKCGTDRQARLTDDAVVR